MNNIILSTTIGYYPVLISKRANSNVPATILR
jgi:hypothetical protein